MSHKAPNSWHSLQDLKQLQRELALARKLEEERRERLAAARRQHTHLIDATRT